MRSMDNLVEPQLPDDREWYILEGDETRGPFTASQILIGFHAGKYTEAALIAKEGDEEWSSLKEMIKKWESSKASATPNTDGPRGPSGERNMPTLYMIQLDGKEEGPFTISQIRNLWNAGRINIRTNFRREKSNDWEPFAGILDLVESSAPSTNLPVTPLGGGTVEQKQRWIYIVFGLFLGGLLGLHNFYAGYYKRAVCQLLLTCTMIGMFITIVWVIAEVVSVTEDANGVPFK